MLQKQPKEILDYLLKELEKPGGADNLERTLQEFAEEAKIEHLRNEEKKDLKRNLSNLGKIKKRFKLQNSEIKKTKQQIKKEQKMLEKLK